MILNSISTTSALVCAKVSCSTLLCTANHLCSSDCLVVSSSSEMSAVHKNVLTAAHLCAYLFRHARSSCANLQKCANPNIYINVHTFPHMQHPKNGLTVQKCFSCMTLLQKPSKVCEPQTTSWSVCFSMACSLTVQKYLSVQRGGPGPGKFGVQGSGGGGILHRMTWTLPQFSHCTDPQTVTRMTMMMLLLMYDSICCTMCNIRGGMVMVEVTGPSVVDKTNLLVGHFTQVCSALSLCFPLMDTFQNNLPQA